MNRTRTNTASAIAAVTISTLIANAGTPTHSWLSPVNGNWNLDTNWDAGTVPGMTSDVLLGLTGPYIVIANSNPQSSSLTISNPDAVLRIDNARTFDLFGNLSNEGLITVNFGGGGSATQFDFESDALISGNGMIQLDSFSTRSRIRSGPGFTVTQSASHTIFGWGQIEAALNNNGLVHANVSNQSLTLNTNDKQNAGTMRSSNNALLDFSGISITQSGAGVIEAVDAGSRIEISSATIIGGELRTDPDAVVNVNSGTFDALDFTTGNIRLLNARTLDIFNSITNNGTITVNPGGGGSATQLDFENSGSFLGSGVVVLDSFSTRARLRTGVGATMTNSANHTIRGWGQIEAALINNGLVSADIPNQELFLNTSDMVNNSTMRSLNTGTLDLGAIDLDQSAGGLLESDGAGSRIDMNSTTVIGGTARSLNGSTIEIASATLDGVVLEGTVNLQNARTLNVLNSLTNNATLTINPGGGGSATQLDFENTGSFLGSGVVVLDSFATRARLRTGFGATMTNSANHTIRGWGQIEAALINNGLVSADITNQELFLNTNDMVNNSTMRSLNTGILDLGAIDLDQSAGGLLEADGAGSRIDMNSTTVIGGTVRAINGATIEIANAALDGVVVEGPLNVQNARTLDISNSITNNGTITVNPGGGGSTTSLRWNDESEIGGNGTIRLESFLTRAQLTVLNNGDTALLGTGQRLEGTGQISAPLIHNGTTAPGLSIGTMLATQPVTYTDTSVFQAEVNATTGDLLDSSSSITIDGTLEVQFIDGFAPTGFWARKVMEGSGITGKFDSVIVPPAPSGFVTRVYNDGSNLFVGQTCPSDTNLDGILNFFDVSVFLSNYNAGDLDADINLDGMLNFFDVSAFLSSYNQGC